MPKKKKKKKKKKKVLVVLESVKFQFPIIFIVNFCNYSFFFLNLEYMLDIKGIWQIQNKINIYLLYELNGLCISGWHK